MKKIFSAALSAVILLSAGCGGNSQSFDSSATSDVGGSSSADSSSSEKPPTLDYVTRIGKSGDRYYIDYRGEPFSLIGGQIRADGLTNRGEGENAPPEGAPAPIGYEEIERYVGAAAAFGLNTVEIPVDWRDVEPRKDEYDFSSLDAYMGACNKYKMKMELLWFSTNMCGDSHSFHLPQYLYDHPETYPKLNSKYHHFSWMYGNVSHFRLDSPSLMEREAKVAEKIGNHIYDWNIANGEKYPVIGIQVHNEPDGLVRWRAQSTQANLAALNDMTLGELWQMTLRALDNAGKAFKRSKYKVYTRVNMTVSLGMDEFTEAPDCSPSDVLALDGIDIVGDDPYIQSAEGIASVIKNYSSEGNYPHIAENMGAYVSGASMMISALASGGGYCLYDFATPKFFVWMNEYYQSTYQMDQGVLKPDLSEKEHSAEVSIAAKGLSACSAPLATLALDHIACFGLNSRSGQAFEESKEVGGIRVTFQSDSGAKGFCFTDGENVTLFSTEDAEFYVEGLAKVGYVGYYIGAEFVRGEKVYPVDGRLRTNGQVVRIALS